MTQNEQLIELRRRTFDTPEFRGIEFIESEAKSIINKVPGNSLPFSHTINPYRGCSHSCSYCQSGETPILMADGRTKPLADVRVGDEIYGTQRVGSYRRYVTAPVLAHWSTVKRAYRIVLEDGTALVASGDHRFLTSRGWKHVTGAYGGPLQRPHLTMNNHLLGTGQFPTPPVHDDDYRRGYECGMIRCDGVVEEMRAIDCCARERLERIGEHIAWPPQRSLSWTTGFLAGIYDAEGSYSRGILRITNTDPRIIDEITRGLCALGFPHAVETTKAKNGLRVVRLLGGVCSALNFFITVDPAITRKRSIAGQAIKNKAKLRVAAIENLGIEIPMYDITTGTGDFIANGVVSHNCFARVTHTYLDMDAGRDFESKIVVKVNAPELLRQELRSRRWKGHPIAMGTATDPYQRAEGRYQLMPGIIGALTDYRNPFSILTKGTLILRDLDLLADATKVADVSAAFSIGTLDGDAWRKTEPGTPSPRKRMEAVGKLNEAGVPTGVMVAPILPGITDDPAMLRDVIRAAADAGAKWVTPILLHLRPVVREEFMEWLAGTYPQLESSYDELYKGRSYAPAARREALERQVDELVRQTGGQVAESRVSRDRRGRRDADPDRTQAGQDSGQQLRLL